MFYVKERQEVLRFGDVLQGYLLSTPVIPEPIVEKPLYDCHIDVGLPKYTVVMDPCCKTKHKMISLSPLIEIWGTFFQNPYFAEDLTRINREMGPQEAVSPQQWESFPEEEKQRRLREGRVYAFENLFIYEPHPLLPKYKVPRREGDIETNYYMLDFRNTYKLRCDKINSPTDAPLESKILQLSIDARSELRNKISTYYGKPPLEDKISED